MSKHTPGPWKHAKQTHVYDNGETQTFGAGTVYAAVKNEDDGYAVATVYGIPSNVTLEDIKGDKRFAVPLANARLLAAAPDLLKALKMWAEGFHSRKLSSSSKAAQGFRADLWEKTNAAIRKAEEVG